MNVIENHRAAFLELNRIAVFDASKGNTEAPYTEAHIRNIYREFVVISRRFVDHVFRLCLENAPDVVVPWPVHPRRPGADLNSERINNQRVYCTFRFVNSPSEPTPPEEGLLLQRGRRCRSRSCAGPLFQEVAKSRRPSSCWRCPNSDAGSVP